MMDGSPTGIFVFLLYDISASFRTFTDIVLIEILSLD